MIYIIRHCSSMILLGLHAGRRAGNYNVSTTPNAYTLMHVNSL